MLQLEKLQLDLGAWDLYQRGMWHLSKTTREDTERARALLRQSAAADPDFATPFAGLGLLGFLEISLGYAADPAQAMAAARMAAATSVRLDEMDPHAQVALGYTSSWNREYDAGLTAARRAVELNPSFALGYHCLGGANFLAGQFDEAVVAMERSVRMSPSDPWLFLFLNGVAGCRYMLKDYERSVEAAQVLGVLALRALHFGASDGGLEGGDDGVGDLVLDRKHVLDGSGRSARPTRDRRPPNRSAGR